MFERPVLTLCITGFAFGLFAASTVVAQDVLPTALANPDLEQADDAGVPAGWRFVTRPDGEGQTIVLDAENVVTGVSSVRIDTSAGDNRFTNLMQSVDATAYQGKKVRFRAAVRTANLAAGSTAQLWFRVDLATKSGETEMGAFDNMRDRPIRGTEWNHHDIVLPVADDASSLNVGMFVLGAGTAWIDDVSLEVVSDDTESTATSTGGGAPRIPREVWEAAEHAPQQPFFTPWLWLALVALALFAVSYGDIASGRASLLPKLGLRFAAIYWFLYSLPTPFNALTFGLLSPLFGVYDRLVDAVVRGTASGVLGVERTLVPPNGSGDTTYDYVHVLVCFTVALTGAAVWAALDRRRTDDRILRDLVRVYVRYVLALTLLGYGLAKVGSVYSQFPEPGAAQLGQTYGESSPMNLVWTFMGASRAYTTFAGLGEIAGGVLLLWRRTTTLGALVSFGVLLNVMMLNFCYDVPVKQYSAHLLVMALFLLLPEARRLTGVLLLNRSSEPVDQSFPIASIAMRRVKLALKVVVLLVAVLIPVLADVWREVQNQPTGEVAAERERIRQEHLLMSRGFRWINEVPFNR